ncbi:MAG: gamma carbonic anhydrase family protein [Neomegalonema sp.]|nr:gamma carbonic anhydrase family protein [Neomegalonema sp.]
MEAVYSLDGIAPVIEEDVWIAPGARVIGNVILRRGVSIWFNAVLRGDGEAIEIGEGSNVQDGTVVHTDPGCPVFTGANVTIGHNAIIHGCTIKEQALIGMGATVLNRAVIGEKCLVGANALVTEGKRFEAGSLIVGAPAKAVRSLDEQARAGLLKSAEGYRSRAQRYRSSFKPV